jgi:hypothetical protein
MAHTWQAKADALIAERDAKIPKEWLLAPDVAKAAHPRVLSVFADSGLLTPGELEITDFKNDATSLLARLANGSLSAVQVTLAFCKRAAIAQQLTNCLVDFFPEEALQRAKELDEYLQTHGKPIGALWRPAPAFKLTATGPLHGLPMFAVPPDRSSAHAEAQLHQGPPCSERQRRRSWLQHSRVGRQEDVPGRCAMGRSPAHCGRRLLLPHHHCASFGARTTRLISLAAPSHHAFVGAGHLHAFWLTLRQRDELVLGCHFKPVEHDAQPWRVRFICTLLEDSPIPCRSSGGEAALMAACGSPFGLGWAPLRKPCTA